MSPNQAFPPVNPSANLEVVENQVPIAESNGTFPIVGIGASAGGFEAFQHFLRQLPVDIGMAFIFVQHLNPQHESHLTELLTRCTTMPILEGMQGVSVRPNHVYVIPHNSNMAIIQSKIHIRPREESRVPHLPVDFLFRSLAQDQQSRAIGVILSGSGSDGALGVCEIKAVDGITFAQEEKQPNIQECLIAPLKVAVLTLFYLPKRLPNA
jgi:two-component system, chemotaxis family, CheB/CheR fusion protein